MNKTEYAQIIYKTKTNISISFDMEDIQSVTKSLQVGDNKYLREEKTSRTLHTT